MVYWYKMDTYNSSTLGIGYGDDFGVPMAALFQVVMFIDVKIMQDLFGADIDTSEVDNKL